MIVTSHQPNFLPYLGVFYKAYKSDILVLSDDVQYSKSGMHNYNVIRSKKGEQSITVPISAHHDTRLCDIIISGPDRTLPKIVRTLSETYAGTPHYEEGKELLGIIQGYANLGDAYHDVRLTQMNEALIRHILHRMGIKTHILIATKDLSIIGHKDDRILMMCQQTAASVYYSGIGAKAYHDEERFRKVGVKLVYSDYTPVVYRQKHDPFIPNMSVIDYVFNEGYKMPEGWL